jgi:hypothetical protein
MNGPTKTVGPPLTSLPARKSRGVLEKVLDNADVVIDGTWPGDLPEESNHVVSRVKLSATQRTDMWSCWKAGQSLHQIGRAPSARAMFPFAFRCRSTVGLFRSPVGARSEHSHWLSEKTSKTLGFETPASRLRASVVPTH